MFIPDPDLDFFTIPDPVVKTPPDPRSRSATLVQIMTDPDPAGPNIYGCGPNNTASRWPFSFSSACTRRTSYGGWRQLLKVRHLHVLMLEEKCKLSPVHILCSATGQTAPEQRRSVTIYSICIRIDPHWFDSPESKSSSHETGKNLTLLHWSWPPN